MKLVHLLAVAAVVVLLSAAPGVAASWHTDEIDTAVGAWHGLSNSSLLLGGLPHVFTYDVTNHDLRHEWWTGSAWASETLDGNGGPNGQTTDDVGTGSSALLIGGLPHVFYADLTVSASGKVLRHGWWTGSTWRFETLDGLGGGNGRTADYVNGPTSAALVGSVPHVWYRDEVEGDLRHAWWTGATWRFETLDGSGGANGQTINDVGVTSSVTVWNGQPHVFYGDQTDGDLRHAWWDGIAWRFETLDGTGPDPAGRMGIAMQYGSAPTVFGGTLHVWYQGQVGNNYLRHAWWTGNGWRFETLDGDGGADGRLYPNVGSFPAVTIFGGAPHVFYSDDHNRDLRHAWWTGSRWRFETVDTGGTDGVGTDNSVLVMGASLHAFHFHSETAQLRHTWYG